jgi:hypothetical protein
MKWVELRKNGQFLRYLPEIWEREMIMPKWFQVTSWMWTKGFESFVVFACNMQEIYGLFDDNGKCSAFIYVEQQEISQQMVIHCSVIEKLDHCILINQCAALRDQFFHRGIRSVRGWTLRKNKSLEPIMKGVGMEPTGLTFDQGEYRGKVLSWDLWQVRTA